MPHPRSPTVLPAHRETLPSYLARLAASRGLSSSYYAGALRSSLKDIVTAGAGSLLALAQWGRLSDEQLAELVSWTGERIGDVRMKLRGEVFVSRALRNPIIRGCPACLRYDLGKRSPEDPPIAVM